MSYLLFLAKALRRFPRMDRQKLPARGPAVIGRKRAKWAFLFKTKKTFTCKSRPTLSLIGQSHSNSVPTATVIKPIWQHLICYCFGVTFLLFLTSIPEMLFLYFYIAPNFHLYYYPLWDLVILYCSIKKSQYGNDKATTTSQSETQTRILTIDHWQRTKSMILTRPPSFSFEYFIKKFHKDK